MRTFAICLGLAVAPLSWLAGSAAAQSPPPPASKEETEEQRIFKSIQWTQGPAKVEIGPHGLLSVPEGYLFAGASGTRKMMELMHNPTDGSELGLLTPAEKMEWFVLFEFSDIGYVKDADKEKLDAKEILDSIREGNESSNEARKEKGWAPIRIVGWQTEPFYNKQTNNLEWCIEGESQGHKIINYNTRILGRQGVMSANLMVDAEELVATLPVIKGLLGGYSFVEGKRYAEYRSGDKIAKYGLSALVVGGAVGLAAKAGLLGKLAASLGKLWKLVIVGLVAVGATIKRLFTGRGREQAPPPSAPPPSAPPQV